MSGRTALVSGGNRGIGLAVARALHADGDSVAVTCRSAPPPDDDFLAVKCDVTSTGSVDDAVTEVEERLGPVQVLVANAGITRDALLVRMGEEDFLDVLDTNLTGAVRLVRRTLRGMIRRRHGRIVLISSSSALSGSPGQTNYAAAKAGMVGFARSLARELGPRDITVNVVTPGWIDTDMTADLPGEARDQAAATVPLGRFGSPDEVAAAVRFLAGRQAGYITGAVVPVDGGIGMGH
ncbi:3-oxoacyl-ACP reductase FabG [Streptomyces griseoflavus]|uniref:3-oxoacyl-ACP reductase FabG n=1 Tax=Streptomyces griseoflavus TaxID=35619 RepID=UPI00167F0558|nr:3-oxoacyl-ACP reductase FabG [Streptomyces griseoflavus]GGV28966.1 beta-ketoacyl-ACP reductase [Streptomyces griseoflavus]